MRACTLLSLSLLLVAPLRADFEAALSLYQQHRYAEAQALFERMAEQHPQDPQVQLHLGKLAHLRGELPLAIEYLEKAVSLAPEDPAAHFELGAACSLHADTLGFTFRAASLARRGRNGLERAVELAPTNMRYRLGLLEFYSTAPSIVGGGIAKAREQAEAIRQLDPLQGALAFGGLARQQKRHVEAMHHWQEALALDPNHAFALLRFGEAAALTGEKRAQGQAALERCLALPEAAQSVSLAQVHWRLGQLHAQQNNVEAARASLRAALAIDPMNKDMATDLARLPPAPSPDE